MAGDVAARRDAHIRLFCLPYAASAFLVYRDWHQLLSEGMATTLSGAVNWGACKVAIVLSMETPMIGPDVLACVPGMRILATSVVGINNVSENPAIHELLTECWRAAGELSKEYTSPQAHPKVAPWRDALRALGIAGKKFPCSIESMLRRTFKSQDPLRINPLTDFLHALSLKHLVPLGGFDSSAIGGMLELRRTRAGDKFKSFDSEQAVEVEPNEVAYAWQHHVLTRHFVWRQSAHALLTPETIDAIIVVELLPEIDKARTTLLSKELTEGLTRHFGTPAEPHILDSDGTADLTAR